MLHRILTALTSKAAIGVAVGTLAAGAAATAGPALVNDTRPDDRGTETDLLESSDDAGTEKTTDVETDEAHGHDGDDRGKADASHAGTGRTDSFGAIVSEDARDGGVDGQEISELARERNAERAADRSGSSDDSAEADDDGDEDEPGRGRSDDHRGDDQRADRDREGDEDSDSDED